MISLQAMSPLRDHSTFASNDRKASRPLTSNGWLYSLCRPHRVTEGHPRLANSLPKEFPAVRIQTLALINSEESSETVLKGLQLKITQLNLPDGNFFQATNGTRMIRSRFDH